MERTIASVMTESEKIETPSGKNAETENFPVGSILIRPDLRPHVHAFYLFARAADDISDNPLLSAKDKVLRLDCFGAALVDDKILDVPGVVPLRNSLKATGVTPQHSLDLLTAFKRDASQLRYRDWDDLMDYCRFSASPVGRHVLALHGIGENTWPANDALCSALQVINHIQDCACDYRELDRVYVPLNILKAHRSDPAELAQSKSTPGLTAALQEMLDKTEQLLSVARGFPPVVTDTRLKMEVSVICVIAERLVKLLRRRDPLCDNVKLSKPSLAAAALTGIFRAWF